jgi:hypothetical protein
VALRMPTAMLFQAIISIIKVLLIENLTFSLKLCTNKNKINSKLNYGQT